MPESPDSERIPLSYSSVAQVRPQGRFLSFLSYLVFEGHGVRIGLELSLCIVSYSLVSVLVPWQALGVSAKWSTLISWFGCSFAIIIFDQMFLCRSAFTLRKSYLLNLGGAYEKALEMLEQIGPASNNLIRLPAKIYHLFRAEVHIQLKNYSQAEADLRSAEHAGAEQKELCIAKSRFYRAQGNFEEAERELGIAKEAYGKNPVLLFEEGLLLLEKTDQAWAAKKVFKEAMSLPEAPHFAGETTYQLAYAYWNVTRLKTGEAEEGLEELNRSIERFRSSAQYIDTLRPVLASLLMERSLYHATHKEPTAAVADLQVGLMHCTYPSIIKKSEKIKEELQWRFELSVP